MRILVDAHVLLWAATEGVESVNSKLSTSARECSSTELMRSWLARARRRR